VNNLTGRYAEGQLGYTSVDTQPTPRRVSSFRVRITAVAAANKHSAAVSDTGEVFTWGCNKEGQLGYGTSNSASNYYPRLVEYLKGKAFKGVSAAKYHTVVLGVDGEVLFLIEDIKPW
jgi:inhibitor of Bruton tyrosine kinase